jgi:hypothetical protein
VSTNRKRKYGSIRQGAETSAGTNDDVFAKFLPPGGEDAPAPPTTFPSTPPSTRPRTPSHPLVARPRRNVSPQRDYQKVANSITRDALPAGMFNGKAKHLYDCLYSLTRGAIAPKMSVRISRAELMKQSGIGAKVTLEQNLRRLTAVGLVAYKTIGGIQGGNEYTVYTPDEIALPSTPPSTGASPPSPPSGGEKPGALAPLVSRGASHGLNVGESGSSGAPNTLFKTNTERTDDEAFAELLAAERELTGRNSPTGRWAELVEVLVTELKIAAGRTTVSSVPAFLAEHLRRRSVEERQATTRC